MKAVLLRQATGGRARSGGWATGGKVLGPRELVFSTHGKFRKRIRRQLEGVPEMIADLSKALAPGLSVMVLRDTSVVVMPYRWCVFVCVRVLSFLMADKKLLLFCTDETLVLV